MRTLLAVVGDGTAAPVLETALLVARSFKSRIVGLNALTTEYAVVFGGEMGLNYPLQEAPPAPIKEFLIDRHEVTNEEYKKFVDAGGYQKREYWKWRHERSDADRK